VRYSLDNKSGGSRLAAVGSPGLWAGDGLRLILDLAAQQRLRTLLRAPSTAFRCTKLERASVRQSGCHAPDPGSFELVCQTQNLRVAGESEGPGLAFSEPGILHSELPAYLMDGNLNP
jgi:hypothetical protein